MKLTSPILIVAASTILLVGEVPLGAQATPTQTRSAPKEPLPPAGKLVMVPHPSEPVVSLDQLIRIAPLIVDGIVASVMPSIARVPGEPGAVETDSLIKIQSVIRGKPATPSQILLMANGGTQGQWQVSVAGEPLVKAGERYILFLAPDLRATVPNSAGVIPNASVAARYYSVGYGNKALISAAGIVQFDAGALAELHQYDKANVSSMISAINSRISTLSPTPPRFQKILMRRLRRRAFSRLSQDRIRGRCRDLFLLQTRHPRTLNRCLKST